MTEEIARLHKKLSNEKFVANAPEEMVEAEREKLAEYREAQERLQVALSRVRDAGSVSPESAVFSQLSRAGRADPMRGRRTPTAGKAQSAAAFSSQCCRKATASGPSP